MKGSGNIAWIRVTPPGCARAMAVQKIAASGAPEGVPVRKGRRAPSQRVPTKTWRQPALRSPHSCEGREKRKALASRRMERGR